MPYQGEDSAVLQSIERRALTRGTEHLLGICAGIAADGALSDGELRFLDAWLAQCPEVANEWPGKYVAQRIRSLLAMERIEEQQRQDMLEVLRGVGGFRLSDGEGVATGLALVPADADVSVQFQGRAFCFTGNFLFGSREDCIRETTARSADVNERVTGALDYLVVGTLVESSWAHSSYGRKLEKALAYREKGHAITILSERQWAQALEAA